MSLTGSLSEIVSRLEDWRQFPKYALERRLDIFLTLFLAPYLSQRMEAQVELVAPEFPLKRPDNAQSTNIDYLLHRCRGEREPAWVFLELNTDERSISPGQLEIYLRAYQRPFSEVLKDVEKGIAPSSKQRQKYERLVERVREGGDARLPDCVEIAYLSPKRPSDDRRVQWFPLKDFASWRPAAHLELWGRLSPLIAMLGSDEG